MSSVALTWILSSFLGQSNNRIHTRERKEQQRQTLPFLILVLTLVNMLTVRRKTDTTYFQATWRPGKLMSLWCSLEHCYLAAFFGDEFTAKCSLSMIRFLSTWQEEMGKRKSKHRKGKET